VLRQTLNVVGLALVLVVNGLANALPLNGQTTGQISDRFAVYFVPAGYVFSIWGIIYVGLIAFAVYQVLSSQRANPRLRGIDGLFVVSCVANSAWIFLWHFEVFAWTLVAMGTLLVSLIAIYLRLGIGRARASAAEQWLVHVPFSVYLGWVTVATIANVTTVLYWAGWGGWGVPPQAWAVVMLVAGAAITAAVIVSRADVAYALVIVWAYVGVAVKQAGVTEVAYTAVAMAILVALVTVLSPVLHRRPVAAGS
jgi:benzodiazapine receptor